MKTLLCLGLLWTPAVAFTQDNRSAPEGEAKKAAALAENLRKLASDLEHGEEAKRLEALRALTDLGPAAAPALKSVLARLGDKSLEVRLEAAAALGSMGKAATPALILELAAKDAERRYLAALALSLMGPAGEEAVPALIRAVRDDNLPVRLKAVYALGRMAPRSVPALPTLSKLLEDKDDWLQVEAFDALLRFKQLALPVVPNILDLPAEKHRSWGLRLLAHLAPFHEKEALPYLLKALVSSHADVRLGCLNGLHAVSAVPIEPLVRRLGDASPQVRHKALEVLAKQEQVGQAKAALEQALVDGHEPVQQLAVETLVRLKENPWAMLENHLKRPAAADRFHAARYMLKANPEYKVALAAQLRVLREEKGALRHGAALALGQSKQPESKEAIPVIADDLRDKDPQVRVKTLGILYYIIPYDPQAALPPVAALMKDPDISVREHVAFALSRFGKLAWPHIQEMAKDPAGGVRAMLYNSVGENVRDTEELLPFLKDAVLKEKDETAKRGAIWSLNWFEAKTVGPFMHQVYRQEKNPKLREVLVDVACRFGVNGAGAIPLFIAGLKDSEPRTRQLAANALRFINPPAVAAIPALTQAAKDADPDVREAVAVTLQHLQKK